MGPRQNAHFTINLTNLSIASAVSSFTFQQQFFDYLALYLLKYSLDQRLVEEPCSTVVLADGTDQAELQRFLTTKSLRQANLALVGTLIITFGMAALTS